MIYLSLAVSLGLTLLIELLVALLWGLRGRELWMVVLVNCLTNPPVVLLYHLTRGLALPPLAIQLPLEIAAVWVEGAIYRTIGGLRSAWQLSIACNVASYGCGLLLMLL